MPDLTPRTELLAGLGADLDGDGWPVVDPSGAASVPGVWAIGNAASSAHKVIHAAAPDTSAAEAVNDDLLHTDIASVR